jgi:protein TonB
MLALARRKPEHKRRLLVLLGVLLLHVVAIGSLLAFHESQTPVVTVVPFPDFVPPGPGGTPGGGQGGKGGHASVTPKKIVRASPAATPLFATPQPIASETATEVAEASPAPTDAAAVPGGPGTDGSGLPGPVGPGTGGGGDGTCPDCPPVIEVGQPGGLVAMPDHDGQDPPYPAAARALGLTGHVVIALIVSPDGVVQSATLVSGSRVFADPALVTVRKWRYEPLFVSGRPVAWRATIRLEFQLR